VGKAVTITGSGFIGTTGVTFNGTPAVFTVASDTTIQTTVPSAALTGPIAVSNPVGTATSATAFQVKPKLKSFSPAFGPVGTTVVIKGTAFTGATKVTFGGVVAVFTVNSYTKITASVPLGAATGRIVVTTPGGKATSKSDFVVT
jgi:hypothetical protein